MADQTYSPAIYKRDGGNTLVCASGSTVAVGVGVAGPEQTVRTRFTTAQVNAGATVLPALPGYAYRVTDSTMIAVGGAAATATSVDISGTQAAAGVKLVSVAVAALTRSAVVKPHSASVTVLADGASFAANDANTAITIGVTGSALATATAIDVVLTYAVEVQ